MNKLMLILMPLIILLGGCAGLQGPLTDAALGAGGGLLGDKLSGGNPYAIAGGAAGGVLLGEGLRAWKKHDENEDYTSGYVRGRSDSAQQDYWSLQDAQKTPPNPK